jgi:hypothetical protein
MQVSFYPIAAFGAFSMGLLPEIFPNDRTITSHFLRNELSCPEFVQRCSLQLQSNFSIGTSDSHDKCHKRRSATAQAGDSSKPLERPWRLV